MLHFWDADGCRLLRAKCCATKILRGESEVVERRLVMVVGLDFVGSVTITCVLRQREFKRFKIVSFISK